MLLNFVQLVKFLNVKYIATVKKELTSLLNADAT